MSLVVRIALVLGLALLAGGTAVAPHELAAGWSHVGLDHPPSALHNMLLDHAGYFASPSGPTEDAFVLASSPASIAQSSLALALLAAPRIRPWRPSPGGVRRILLILANAQRVIAPPARPPRAPFSI
jgi:hypothetical protein